VTVVGLGPAGAELLGVETRTLLSEAPHVFFRTGRHPAAGTVLPAGARTFDELYESAESFDEVYAGIVEELVVAAERAAPAPVVYAVPGSPLVAERTVALLRADSRVDVTVLPALSFLDLAWAALGVDPLSVGVRLVDAADFTSAAASERGPFLVAQCWSRHILSEIKLARSEAGAATPRPVLLHHLGLADEKVVPVDWWDLDRMIEPDHLTSLYVPAVEVAGPAAAGVEVARLVELMDTLRERCPWDQAQTHASLMPHLVEECYEVIDALAALDGDEEPGWHAVEGAAYDHLEEELGDLLFQIVFHARLASETGRFALADVARAVHDKLVHRHPHVFGDVDVDGPDQVVRNWEAIKKTEKGRTSVTEGIPSALPALMLTTKLARKARAVGIEPGRIGPEDLRSAWEMLMSAAGGEPDADEPLAADATELSRVVGGLLYTVATLAQRAGVDAELALRDRALTLRTEVRAAEGVPSQEFPNR
jgi:tetrapyrrole methylase family protein / MazG family protein